MLRNAAIDQQMEKHFKAEGRWAAAQKTIDEYFAGKPEKVTPRSSCGPDDHSVFHTTAAATTTRPINSNFKNPLGRRPASMLVLGCHSQCFKR